MQKSALFRGFDETDVPKMLRCLGAKVRICNTNETIMSYKQTPDYLYVVLSGSAHLVSYDYDGNKTILERFSENSVFGDMFLRPSGKDELRICATAPCKILTFRYNDAIKQCENACNRHTLLLDNLFRLLSEKVLHQSQHIEVLTRRTTRQKLMTYFEHLVQQNSSFSFVLPMSLSALADFLGIDRSAMQREIKKLNDEGVIESKRKKITVIK